VPDLLRRHGWRSAAIDTGAATAEAEAAVCRIVAASGGQLVYRPLRPQLTGRGERAAAGPGLVAARRLVLTARLVTGLHQGRASRADALARDRRLAGRGPGRGRGRDERGRGRLPVRHRVLAHRPTGGGWFPVDLPAAGTKSPTAAR
jgi:hypothetical protein